MTQSAVHGGLDRASVLGVEGWDGYYAEVAVREGVKAVVTLDTDFDRFDGVHAEVLLSPSDHERLTEYLETGG